MKIGYQNINKRSTQTQAPLFVSDITSLGFDILCLGEYTDDINIDKSLSDHEYLFFKSKNTQGNQVLLAVKNDFMRIDSLEVIRDTDEPGDFNFLHIRFTMMNGEVLNVIGIRMLTGAGKNAMNAAVQTPPLRRYLNAITEPYICFGDFNIREERMSKWFGADKNYTNSVFLSRSKQNEFSFVCADRFTGIINGGIVLDHILTNIKADLVANYDWSFTKKDPVYPPTVSNGHLWQIPIGYPDHAIMWCVV